MLSMNISNKFYKNQILLILGQAYACDTIWVIGDHFMTFSAQCFNEIRAKEQKDKSQSYIDTHYDVKFICTPLNAQPNVLLCLNNAFVGEKVPKYMDFGIKVI